MSSQIVQVQSGQTNVPLGRVLNDQNTKVIVSRREFRKIDPNAFTALLTDLGPGVLFTAPYTLTGATEDAQTVASITPGFAGRVSAAFAVVSTAVTTGSKNANFQVFVDNAPGTNAVQSLNTTGVPTGGTFTLTFNGQTTAAIAFNAAAATVQTALTNLSNVAVGDVVCAGGALTTAPVTLTWGGSYANQVVALPALGTNSLTGGTTPNITVTTTTAGDPGSDLFAPGPLSGGLIALTSANATPTGKVVPGTSIVWTALNSSYSAWSFTSTGVISFRTSGVPVAFAEGAVMFGVLLEPDVPVNQLSNVRGPFLV